MLRTPRSVLADMFFYSLLGIVAQMLMGFGAALMVLGLLVSWFL